jgi:hypothetical protein
MIDSLVSCLAHEHLNLDEQILQLTLVATRLAADPNPNQAGPQTTEVWEGIRRYLRSHLQIEDEVVLAWGEAHYAIAGTLGATLERERQELRRLLAVLGSYAGPRATPRDSRDRGGFAKSLLALSRTLATHVERY